MNEAIEKEWMINQPRIANWGLSVGSKIMWLRNDYTKAPVTDDTAHPVTNPVTGEPVCTGFMNGSLGILKSATAAGAWGEFDDGSSDEISLHDLESLTSGWAISIHKAQGSAFKRVIVPISRSRLLDRSLLYTGITRAIETCVLIGDRELLRIAVESEPRANRRIECMNFDNAIAGLRA